MTSQPTRVYADATPNSFGWKRPPKRLLQLGRYTGLISDERIIALRNRQVNARDKRAQPMDCITATPVEII